MRLSPEEKSFMLHLHNPKNPNAAEVARKFEENYRRSTSHSTVSNVWRDKGLKIGSRGGKRHGMSDDEMRKAFYECKGNPHQAAKDYNYTECSFRTRWKKIGLYRKF
jgi:hypothetical protein|tara:strand:+ start:1341 stop:1661 length:321 start_codon:yes stop_codon:yes gene_type:complete